MDETGKLRGKIYRLLQSERDTHSPKDLNEIDRDWVMLHFPSPIRGKACIIVEDIPSANKVDKLFPCVALLGTHLNEEKLSYLLNLGIRHVIIALDNDATRKAIKLTRKFCINTSILPLQRDLKDEPEESLKRIIGELNEI